MYIQIFTTLHFLYNDGIKNKIKHLSNTHFISTRKNVYHHEELKKYITGNHKKLPPTKGHRKRYPLLKNEISHM